MSSTREIRTSIDITACDICGRTLLRGERAEMFIAGGHRHQVCELCKPRALQEGWIREGSVPDYDLAALAQDRRRSMFGRRRRTRTEAARDTNGPTPATTLDDALAGDAWPTDLTPPDAPGRRGSRRRQERTAAPGRPAERERPARERPPRERLSRGRQADRAPGASDAVASPPREPRQVHAVPTADDSKIAAAVEAFNLSEHPRTVAGVSRSLGAPTVAVLPDRAHSTLVRLVASWELCWYRYEIDLGATRPSVRLDAQGYELSELSPPERSAVVVADDGGRLHAR